MMKKNRQPSLRALKAFDAVSRHLQMNKAAQELCVTPSAISHLIKRLEDDLGTTLIKHTGRNIELTTAGEQFAPGIQKTFRSLKHIIEDIRDHSNPNILNVSLRPYFAVKWLSPRLSRFWTKHPEIELRLIHTTKPVDYFNERIDLAIEWCEGERLGINYSLLIKGELTPVLSPKLPGAQKISQPSDLFQYTLLRETDHNSWHDWFALVEETYEAPAHTLFIDDSNVRYQAALDGQGVELSCRSLIQSDLQAGRLLCPFELSLTRFSYYLAEPEHRQTTSAAEKFISWLKHEARKDQITNLK